MPTGVAHEVAASDALVIVSCGMSFVGATMIMATSLFDSHLRRQPGRRVICCLSLADAASAVVYGATPALRYFSGATFTSLCDLQALAGIFFPVASFVWTDCLAYVVYSGSSEAVNVLQAPRSRASEQLRFALFCVLSWGIPALCVGFVAGFHREGFSSPNAQETATGGWCWIKRVNESDSRTVMNNSPEEDQLVWEMIGGRIVEWTTIFVIVPCLYLLTHARVRRVIAAWTGSSRRRQRQNVERRTSLFESRQEHSRTSSPGVGAGSEYGSEYGSRSGGDGARGAGGGATELRLPDHSLVSMDGFRTRLLLVPALLLLARIWGSLRTALSFVPVLAPYIGWIAYMQAFFDPAQGWLNSIVFILLNARARRALCSCSARARRARGAHKSFALTGSATWQDPTSIRTAESPTRAYSSTARSLLSGSQRLSSSLLTVTEPLAPVVNWEEGSSAPTRHLVAPPAEDSLL